MTSLSSHSEEAMIETAAASAVPIDNDHHESADHEDMDTIPVIQLTDTNTDASFATGTDAGSDESGGGGDIESATAVVQAPPGDNGTFSVSDLACSPIAYQIVDAHQEGQPPLACRLGNGSDLLDHHHHDSSCFWNESSHMMLHTPLQQRRAEFMSATIIKPTKDSPIGMELVTKQDSVVISSITPNSLMDTTPFQVGDRLLSVNNKRCYIMDAKDVEIYMAPLEGPVTLIVHHEGGDPNLVESMVVKPSDESRCGLRLVSSGDGNRLKMSHIDANGVFFESLLNVGDSLVSINGEDCEHCNVEGAVEMIIKAGRLITIKAKTLLENGVVVAAFSSNNSVGSNTSHRGFFGTHLLSEGSQPSIMMMAAVATALAVILVIFGLFVVP